MDKVIKERIIFFLLGALALACIFGIRYLYEEQLISSQIALVLSVLNFLIFGFILYKKRIRK